MSEEVKTGTTARKTAPAIIVNSPASRSSIDELHRDNPGKQFAYCPLNPPEASLTGRGLVPVKDGSGHPLKVGNRMIVQVVSDVQAKETAEKYRNSSDIAKILRDPRTSSSDKTATPKKPSKSKIGDEQ